MPKKQFYGTSIYYGIKTGCNEAFIVDAATRERLISEDPASEEILKPVLRGRDIERYRANWAGRWLIDTHNGYSNVSPIDIDDYPAIKAHLDSDRFIKQLERRQDKGVTPYNLRSCAYHEDFSKEKLLWMTMAGNKPRFAYFPSEMYCNDAGNIITGASIKFLCAVLNSKIITWFVMNTAPTSGAGTVQWKLFVIQDIPVPMISKSDQQPVVKLLNNILKNPAHKNDHTTTLEDSIDKQVYAMYQLTEQEIVEIEKRITWLWRA